jgi:hypothetical protein
MKTPGGSLCCGSGRLGFQNFYSCLGVIFVAGLLDATSDGNLDRHSSLRTLFGDAIADNTAGRVIYAPHFGKDGQKTWAACTCSSAYLPNAALFPVHRQNSKHLPLRDPS